jgi:hypothetical protein
VKRVLFLSKYGRKMPKIRSFLPPISSSAHLQLGQFLIYGRYNSNRNANYYNYQKKDSQEQQSNNLLVHRCKILHVVRTFSNNNFVKLLQPSIKSKSNHLMETNSISKNFVKPTPSFSPTSLDKLSIKQLNNIETI